MDIQQLLHHIAEFYSSYIYKKFVASILL